MSSAYELHGQRGVGLSALLPRKDAALRLSEVTVGGSGGLTVAPRSPARYRSGPRARTISAPAASGQRKTPTKPISMLRVSGEVRITVKPYR